MSEKCAFVREYAPVYAVRELCETVKLASVTYYRSLKKTEAALKIAENGLTEQVRTVFNEHSRRYGSRRIHAELSARGLSCGSHRVRRAMAENGLRAIQPRSFVPRTTQSRHRLGYSRNLLLDLKLPPERPRRVVVSDITYLPLVSGKWAYLATFTDLFSRRILGWAVQETMTEDLILAAARMMFNRFTLATNAIIHSDRGGQYAGKRFRNLLKHNRCRQSMSRAGETYDNAFAESLFSRYKAELLENGAFANVAEARMETFNYIEIYYNKRRRHSGINYEIPEEYEKRMAAERDEKLGEKLDQQKEKGIKVNQHSCNTI